MLVDATHAIPFVPVQPWIADIDYLVCHGYKHCSARAAWRSFHMHRDRWHDVQPWLANWRAGDPMYSRSYGGNLDNLARDARRFDVSLAWHAWAGASRRSRCSSTGNSVGFSRTFRCLQIVWHQDWVWRSRPLNRQSRVQDAEAAEIALAETGVRCAARSGNIRCLHTSTTRRGCRSGHRRALAFVT
jgi:hypothetical protein